MRGAVRAEWFGENDLAFDCGLFADPKGRTAIHCGRGGDGVGTRGAGEAAAGKAGICFPALAFAAFPDRGGKSGNCGKELGAGKNRFERANVEPRDRLRRLAFEGQGVIAEIAIDVGTEVKAGEVLARLDSRRAMADLEVARSLQAVAESAG